MRNFMVSIFALSAILASSKAYAANDFAYTVYGDGYYSYNLNSPSSLTNTYRAYDVAHNSFELNNAGLTLKKDLKDFGFFAELDFGRQADAMNGNTSNGRNVSQAYVTLKPSKMNGWTLDFGKFFTHMGNETPFSKDNWNYSRSVAFVYAIPTWHVGARLLGPTGEKLTTSFFVVNNWGATDMQDNNKSKSVGAQLKFAPSDKLSLTYNGIMGAEKNNNEADLKSVHELIAQFVATPKMQFAGDLIIGSEENGHAPDNSVSANRSKAKFNSIAAYAKFDIDSDFYFSPRVEFYSADEQNIGTLTADDDEKVTSITLTVGHKLGEGLDARYEVRNDKSDENNAFRDGATDFNDDQTTLTAAVMFQF